MGTRHLEQSQRALLTPGYEMPEYVTPAKIIMNGKCSLLMMVLAFKDHQDEVEK